MRDIFISCVITARGSHLFLFLPQTIESYEADLFLSRAFDHLSDTITRLCSGREPFCIWGRLISRGCSFRESAHFSLLRSHLFHRFLRLNGLDENRLSVSNENSTWKISITHTHHSCLSSFCLNDYHLFITYVHWALLVPALGTAISTASVSVTVSTTTSWRTWRQVNGVRRDPRDHPASGFQDRRPRRTTPSHKSGAARFPQEPLFRAASYTSTLIRGRGRAGWRDTSPAGGSSPTWKERPAGNICVTWGAFRGCGPVRPSVSSAARSPRNCHILRCCRGVYARVARCIAAQPPPPLPPLPKSSHRSIVHPMHRPTKGGGSEESTKCVRKSG